MKPISEADWKIFKAVRSVALERFSQRILDECQEICCNEALTAHERYGNLYGVIHKRNTEMAEAFDDFRRSTALLCLRIIWQHELIRSEEMSQFSRETQAIVEFRG
jgi:hypothetical protein